MQKDEKYVSPNENTTMKFDPKKMANIRTVEANDLFISNSSGEALSNYAISKDVGRGYSSTGWSWDADFFDFDNDGDDDLYCLNGMNDFSVYGTENPFYYSDEDEAKNITYAESKREKNVFFVNENGELINRADELGTDILSNARSAAYLDFDNDGDLDIVINNYHDKANFLRNEINENAWLKIELIGSPQDSVNRDAIGATIIVNSENHKGLWREIHSTDGYLSSHPKVQHFGLGKDKFVEAIIRWPNGKEVRIKNLESDRHYKISYPDVFN
jgi:hypothetical protein